MPQDNIERYPMAPGYGRIPGFNSKDLVPLVDQSSEADEMERRADQLQREAARLRRLALVMRMAQSKKP